MIGLPAAAVAQQLWNIEEVAAQPVAPIVMDGMAVTASAAGVPTAEAATVQVTFDYLRLGMGYLELPLPDGSMIAAENAVFEDRGGGNLMWTGQVPGVDALPTGDWCGAEAGPGRDPARSVAATGDRPVSVAAPSRHHRLDILVLYTAEADAHWRFNYGGPAGGVRMAVRGPYRWVAEGEWIQPLPSEAFFLKPRGRVPGSPAAPSNVGGRETGPDRIRLTWRDNSPNETGFEVWYRKWSGEAPDEVWRRYRAPLPAGTRQVEVGALAAEEEEVRVTEDKWHWNGEEWVVLEEGRQARRGRYSFVVVAYNDMGWNASETFEPASRPLTAPAGVHGTTGSRLTSRGFPTSSTGTTRRSWSRSWTAAA